MSTRKNARVGKLLRVAEVAERLATSKSTVYNLMNAGKLRWVRVGESRRVAEDVVERLIADNTHGGDRA